MARPFGAAVLASRGLGGGGNVRLGKLRGRGALRLSGRTRAARGLGREAPRGATRDSHREGAWQLREARRRPGRPSWGAAHAKELSSVAELHLDIDFPSSDWMCICPAHLLEGRSPAQKCEVDLPTRGGRENELSERYKWQGGRAWGLGVPYPASSGTSNM